MAQETMSRYERYQAALSLEKPDRVPVAPLISTPAAINLLGLDAKEIYEAGSLAMLEAEIRMFDKFGGWDAATPLMPPDAMIFGGLKIKVPDGQITEMQILEQENMVVGDYDLIKEIGYRRFVWEHLAPRSIDFGVEEKSRRIMDLIALPGKIAAAYREKEVPLQFACWNSHPFFALSLQRSMVKFTEDLYYRPEKVERALKIATDDFIEYSLDICKRTGVKIAGCNEERAGAFFYPLKIFERFWWPYAEKIVDALWSDGIVTWFHLDTCWDKNLPYFKKLPRGSAVIDLDGTTDIFAAKELLRNHLCISTDVHAALLSLGTPAEVEAYCKKLIDEIGGDGGCILSTGCTMPGAIKADNFRAMIETGKNYELR